MLGNYMLLYTFFVLALIHKKSYYLPIEASYIGKFMKVEQQLTNRENFYGTEAVHYISYIIIGLRARKGINSHYFSTYFRHSSTVTEETTTLLKTHKEAKVRVNVLNTQNKH